MRQINLGRALGLSILAALGLMAMFVAGAQAKEFLVNKKRPTGLLVVLNGEQVGAGSLLIPAKKIEIVCQEGKLDPGVKNHINSPTDALVGVEWPAKDLPAKQNCEVWSYVPETGALKTLLPCDVDLILAKALVLPVLHEGESFLLFEPDEKDLKTGEFTSVLLLGESCPLPVHNPVTGNTLALIDDNETVSPDLLFNKATCELHKKLPGGASAGLFYGGSEACIDAKWTLTAAGEHVNATLGVS